LDKKLNPRPKKAGNKKNRNMVNDRVVENGFFDNLAMKNNISIG